MNREEAKRIVKDYFGMVLDAMPEQEISTPKGENKIDEILSYNKDICWRFDRLGEISKSLEDLIVDGLCKANSLNELFMIYKSYRDLILYLPDCYKMSQISNYIKECYREREHDLIAMLKENK